MVKGKILRRIIWIAFFLAFRACVVFAQSAETTSGTLDKSILAQNLRYTERRLNAIEAGISLTSGVTGILPMASGGTGVSLSDPNDDRILFWDDSAGEMKFLDIGSNLSISGTTISASDGTDFTLGDKDATESSVSFNGTTDPWTPIKQDNFLFSFYKKSQHTNLTVYWKGTVDVADDDVQKIYVDNGTLTGTQKTLTTSYQEFSDTIDISSLSDNAWHYFDIRGNRTGGPQTQSVKEVRWFVD